ATYTQIDVTHRPRPARHHTEPALHQLGLCVAVPDQRARRREYTRHRDFPIGWQRHLQAADVFCLVAHCFSPARSAVTVFSVSAGPRRGARRVVRSCLPKTSGSAPATRPPRPAAPARAYAAGAAHPGLAKLDLPSLTP